MTQSGKENSALSQHPLGKADLTKREIEMLILALRIAAEDGGLFKQDSRGENISSDVRLYDSLRRKLLQPRAVALKASLLDQWRQGAFETTADEAAQAALDDQAVGLDVASIIEAWLTAANPSPETRETGTE